MIGKGSMGVTASAQVNETSSVVMLSFVVRFHAGAASGPLQGLVVSPLNLGAMPLIEGTWDSQRQSFGPSAQYQ